IRRNYDSYFANAGAKIGDEVVLLGMTQDGSLSPIKGRLVGIVRGGGFLDRQVLVPLERMQWLADLEGGATELLVFGESFIGGPALAVRLKRVPGLAAYAVQGWDEREPLASASRVIATVRFLVIGVVVLLAALGIWNTMTTSVLERTREIGVLRAMGLTRAGVVGLVVAEAGTIAVLGGALGVALGAVPSGLLTRYGVRLGGDVTARMNMPVPEVIRGLLTPGIALGSFALGLAMALLGGVPAALRAASIQPVTAMRTGR
ncbi:MAG: FtsX-like permease family protein, partial [bacterium]